MDIRQQLLAAFEAEHREHLDAIRAALAAGAEGRPTDWNDVFRRAHSLKGAARAVDLPPVEAVAHRLETLFEQVSGGGRPLDRTTRGAIHLALDRIEAFVAGMKGGAPAMPDDALAALERCLAGPAQASEATVPQPMPEPVPSPAAPRAAEAAPESDRQAVLRVPAEVVEALTRATHGLANALSGRTAVAEGLAAATARAADLRRRVEALRGNRGNAEAPRGSADGLGEIETVLAALSRDLLDLGRRQRATTAAVEAAVGRVRDEAERLALVPAETAFGDFARSLRELARAERREVDVTMRGLDLPVDRAMLQTLRDPVLHALRNALGHGAEPVETRRAAGKPAALAILLEVEARGSRLVIGVHDDGRGPDLAAIAGRARARGLLAPGEEAEGEIDEARLLGLVFEPGFSTAAGIDTLSGRGIGLAVVQEAARRLGGSARLERRLPHGASLILNLPLSAARRPVILVEAGGETYALPSASVERLLRLEPAMLDTVAGRAVAHVPAVRGAVGDNAGGEGDGAPLGGAEAAAATLPVADLAGLLGTARGMDEAASIVSAILLRVGPRRCVLRVDRLSDVRSLLVLPAPPLGADPELIVGTVVLGSDRPVLVLDPEGLLARAARQPGNAPAGPSKLGREGYVDSHGTMAQAPRSTIRATILVVDDSITTRTLEKSILEAAGYRVVVCVDGQDALDRLRAGIEPVDLVVADVEMPRLDGFGLVKALRAEPAFATLPVILMTSRGASEDVARGLELGADAYLTKQKFDQRELLDTVGQLL